MYLPCGLRETRGGDSKPPDIFERTIRTRNKYLLLRLIAITLIRSPPNAYKTLDAQGDDWRLVVLLGLRGAWRQVPALAVLVPLVLDGDLGQVHDDVLHLGVGTAALGTAEVVEPRPLVEQVVHDGDDDDDTDGVGPDDDDGDDAGVAVGGEEPVVVGGVGGLAGAASKPAEDTEEGSEDIDSEDGADELP